MKNVFEGDELGHFYQKRLAELEELSGKGESLAVAAALNYCAQHDLHPPFWVIDRASTLMNDLLSNEVIQKKRRHDVTRYEKDLVHAERYEWVIAAREARSKRQRDIEELRDIRNKQARTVVDDAKGVLANIGPSDESIFEEVSQQLEDTDAAGGADAVKKSYYRVKDDYENGRAHRYYRYDAYFLKRIGVRLPSEKSQGKPARAALS